MNMLDNNEENVEKTVETNEVLVNEVAEVKVDEPIVVEEVLEENPKAAELEVTASVEKAVDKVQDEVNTEKIVATDYAILSLEELVQELQNTLSNNPVNKIKDQIEVIKSAFNIKFGALLAEKKKVFLEEGGNVIDFQFTSSVKGDYNTLSI